MTRAPRRLADALAALALVLGAGGAAAWLWPARERVAPLPPEIPLAPPALPAPAPDPARALRVAARNPFAATREAPRARWVSADAMDAMGAVTTSQAPPGLLPDPSVRVPGDPLPALDPPPDAPAPAAGDADESRARARDRRVPALFGTVLGGDVPRALLRLDARVPGAQLYAEGAEAGGWRVARVTADAVTLAARGGRTVTLRMPRAAAPR